MASFRPSKALPAPGCDTSEWLEEQRCTLRHGSSLALMKLVIDSLADSEFGDVDPTADWEKWVECRPTFSLYYAALVDPTLEGAASVLCVLRAVEDGRCAHELGSARPVRFVIDSLCVRPEARGRGLARACVDFVAECARQRGAHSFVLAPEDACVFWMGRGFVLEASANLQARLNIFQDTHLLRRADDPGDDGDAADLELAEQHDAIEEEEDDDDDDGHEMGDRDEGDELVDEEDEEDDDGGFEDGEGDDDDDDELLEDDDGFGQIRVVVAGGAVARRQREAELARLADELAASALASPDSAEIKRRHLKLVQNLTHFPDDLKYRRLRTDNPLVQRYLLASLEASDWLAHLGFQRLPEGFLLAPRADADLLVAASRALQAARWT